MGPVDVTRLVRVDHTGPSDLRFDLVVVADGFATGEVGRFHRTFARIRRELLATAPFGTLRGLINLSRLDLTGPATLVTGFTLPDERLLQVDVEAAWELAVRAEADPDAVLVIADSDRYAAAAFDRVAAVTCHGQAPRLALHELGHAVFGLADKYGDNAPSADQPSERCLMRSVHDGFCPVCRIAITRRMVFFGQGRPLG